MSTKLILAILINLVIQFALFSQNFTINGNLLHIDIDAPAIDLSDTTGSWSEFKSDVNDTYSEYESAFRTENNIYLIYSESNYSEYFGSYFFKAFENLSENKQYGYSGYSAVDIPWVFGISTGIYQIKEGFWLVDDTFGYAFISNSDSITVFMNSQENKYSIVHIAGRINDKHLCYCWDWEDFGFTPYLIDLSDSPQIDSSHVNPMKLSQDQILNRIVQIDTNLFLISEVNNSINIYTFENDSLIYIKNLFTDFYFDNWVYRPPYIFIHRDELICRYMFDQENLNIIEKDTLLVADNQIGIDLHFNFATYIDEDSLFLYNINEDKLISSWDLSGVNNRKTPIILFPDIFVHQITSITNIQQPEKDVDNQIVIETYPNPFNSFVKISLPNFNGEEINIEIYNVLGKLIKTINPESNFKFTNSVIWKPDAQNSSGIYFVKVKSERTTKTKKIMYLK